MAPGRPESSPKARARSAHRSHLRFWSIAGSGRTSGSKWPEYRLAWPMPVHLHKRHPGTRGPCLAKWKGANAVPPTPKPKPHPLRRSVLSRRKIQNESYRRCRWVDWALGGIKGTGGASQVVPQSLKQARGTTGARTPNENAKRVYLKTKAHEKWRGLCGPTPGRGPTDPQRPSQAMRFPSCWCNPSKRTMFQ